MAPHNRDTSHHHVTARTPPQTRDATATARTPRRDRHDGHSHDTTDGHDGSTTGTAVIAYSGRGCGCDRIQRNVPAHSTRHATPQANKHSSEQTFDRTHVLMLHIQQPPPWGSLPPGQKAGAAGSLVLTLNARWNIFGLPVTYEVFTYLVVATVSAPYILCIMVFGLMLMMVERSSGLHQYLTAITHCA